MPKKDEIQTRKISVAGSVQTPSPVRETKLGGALKVVEKHAVRIDKSRAVAAPVTIDVADDDVLQLELEGGIKLWTTLPQLHQDFPGAAVPRGLDSSVLDIPTELPIGTPTRGVSSWVIKALKVLGVDVTGTVTGKVAKAVEDRLPVKPGLYRCSDAGGLKLTAASAASLKSDHPLLVFLHGTGSSTEGSFGRLWHPAQDAVLKELRRAYPDRIFALEHRTLTESPIENAVELLELPANARLHLVSHSRGGLIGELLCRGAISAGAEPFDARDRKRFEVPKQQQALDDLNRLLKARQPHVERFVRVACPARGTTLASERLDRWLSVVVNLLSLAGLEGNPVFDLMSDLTLAVVKERTDPRTLPGLEAMMPESALVGMLNRADIGVDSDLTVIAGDAEGEGVWDKLKLLIPDLFYREDHDLVVNTSAMYGGAQRTTPSRYFFDQGPAVNHFSYFQNAATADRLLLGLTQPKDFEAKFATFSPKDPGIPRGARRSGKSPRPIVFVLPGIMGSHLTVKSDRVWIDIPQLAFGGIKHLQIDAEDVKAEALVGHYYADLVDYLETVGGHEVIPFPFDWRASLGQSAKLLAGAVSTKLLEAEAAKQPVRIIAHSMGGLVARAMIAEHDDVWKRLCAHPGGRLVMLGTPNAGSYVIPRLLLGQENLLRLFTVADFAHDGLELLAIFSRYPGLLEMLPVGGDLDLFSDGALEQIEQVVGSGRWIVPQSDALKAARRTRAKLDAQTFDPSHVAYVAGCARSTPIDMKLASKDGVRFIGTWRGDGRVPWDTGIPAGIKPWYIDIEHGSLAAHEPSFPGLLDLLRTGETTRLQSAPPSAPRGVIDGFEIPPDKVQVYPDEQEIVASALGSRRRAKRTRRNVATKVWISYGDLLETKNPVVVGHYANDSIVSAEKLIDKRLGGRLRQHHQLGLYPGEVETAEVFLSPGNKPSGAVVVGLGKVGELTPGGLTATVAHGLTMYAAAVLDNQGKRPASENGPESVTVALLLIGSGDGGFSISDSIVSILRGVRGARQVLLDGKFDRRVSIDGVELIELWEDRVIEAVQALRVIETDPQLKEWFVVEDAVRLVRGRRRRLSFTDNGGWWQRLQVKEENGALRFTALTDRARAPVSLVPGNRALVDRFIEAATRTVATDVEIAKTLFELLLPNEWKERAPDRRNLVMVLDDQAARYPWELLQDRTNPDAKPLAVEAGMLRQLETEVYRQQTLSAVGRTALVIGDPISSFAALPAAEEEARTVDRALRANAFESTAVLRGAATEIVSALHARSYKILHLAGHGVHDYLAPAKAGPCAACGQLQASGTEPCAACGRPRAAQRISGMVLGDDVFLTPGDVEQMRRVPELVFINCCYLGQGVGPDVRSNRHLLAANLAGQFIRMGVKAVVAAGWEVEDSAARIFAETFYTEMLAGGTFGAAVTKARNQAYRDRESVNTWGAYQCYGAPDFQISGTQGGAGSDSPHKPVLVTEVISAVENIASEASTATPEQSAALSEHLSALIAGCSEEWLREAALRAALGRACGELDRFEEAIEHYNQALQANEADFPVRAIEQLANLQARWAVTQWRKSKQSESPLDTLEAAIGRISTVMTLSRSAERLSLLGSAHKRRAWVGKGRSRLADLKSMGAAYREAHERALELTKEVDPYPLVNWLLAEWLLHHIDPRPTRSLRSNIEKWLPRAEAVAAERASEPSFWACVYPIECTLIRHLFVGDLDQHVEAIVDAYRTARGYGASQREFNSVLDQFDFIIDVLRSGKSRTARPLVKALEEIRKQLAS